MKMNAQRPPNGDSLLWPERGGAPRLTLVERSGGAMASLSSWWSVCRWYHPIRPNSLGDSGKQGAKSMRHAVCNWHTISDPTTQAQEQGLNDGMVAAMTLLNEIRAAVVEKGVVKGSA